MSDNRHSTRWTFSLCWSQSEKGSKRPWQRAKKWLRRRPLHRPPVGAMNYLSAAVCLWSAADAVIACERAWDGQAEMVSDWRKTKSKNAAIRVKHRKWLLKGDSEWPIIATLWRRSTICVQQKRLNSLRRCHQMVPKQHCFCCGMNTKKVVFFKQKNSYKSLFWIMSAFSTSGQTTVILR